MPTIADDLFDDFLGRGIDRHCDRRLVGRRLLKAANWLSSSCGGMK